MRRISGSLLSAWLLVGWGLGPGSASAQEGATRRAAVAVNAPEALRARLLTALRAAVEAAGEATVIPDSELAAARGFIVAPDAPLDASSGARLASELRAEALWLLEARPLEDGENEEGRLALAVQRIHPGGAVAQRFAAAPMAFEAALSALVTEIAASEAVVPAASPPPQVVAAVGPGPAAHVPGVVGPQLVAPQIVAAQSPFVPAMPTEPPRPGSPQPMWGLFIPGLAVFLLAYFATPIVTSAVCGGGALCNPGVVDAAWIPFGGGVVAADLENDPVWYSTALGTGIASMVLQIAGITMTILGLSIWRRRDGGQASAGDLVPDLTLGVAPSLGGGMLTGTLRL